MSLHNELVKLTATWLNTLATATATVGVLAPIASAAYGFGPVQLSLATLLAMVAVWLFTAVGLHLAARRVLRGLKL
jgi:hypothetical protein